MKKITLLLGLACFSQSALALETFKTGVPLSSSLGNIEKYDVHLKLVSDDLVFEFLRATKLD